MIYLFLCMLMNVGIFVCFRLFKRFSINTFQAIVLNYITCVLTGIIFIGGAAPFAELSWTEEWVLLAGVLGAIFISTFYLMALTTQKFSMTVSSIAAKMSLVIPVLVSLFVLGIQAKSYTVYNYLGMLLAVISIVLSSYKSSTSKRSNPSWMILLPFFVFVFGGIIDSSINYANHAYLRAKDAALFPILIFASAAIIGTVTLLLRRSYLSVKNLTGGIALGVINYFSMYFLIKGLTAFGNDGAIFYPVLNVGIILMAVVVSVLFFADRLTLVNKIGLGMSVLAIFMISYQEIFGAL